MRGRIAIGIYILSLGIGGCSLTSVTNPPEAKGVMSRCLALHMDGLIYYQWYPREATRYRLAGGPAYHIYIPATGKDTKCSPPTVAAYLSDPESYINGPGIRDWSTTRYTPNRCTREYLGVVKKGTKVQVTEIQRAYSNERGGHWYAFGKIMDPKWNNNMLVLHDWLRIGQEHGRMALYIDEALLIECANTTSSQPSRSSQ